MYYRRKVILALLELFDNSLKNTEFQKLLFLFTVRQEKPSFEFVPYIYGCYSFQTMFDQSAMIKSNHLQANGDNWSIVPSDEEFFNQLTVDDKQSMMELRAKFGDLTLNEIIEYIYNKYPYYAINSKIANRYIEPGTLEPFKANESIPQVFTIGYEGSSIENYINRLIKNNIKAVIDVRKNPISMKPGFSKNQMKSILKKLSINYIHLPEFGIPTVLRNNYLTKEKKDYAALFKVYRKEILGNLDESTSQLKKQVKGQRVALTCFEKDPEFCHRKFVSEAIEDVPIHI